MRIFEVNNFLIAINNLLLESFKEDMYNVYSKDKESDDEKIDDTVFDNAIKTFNNNQQVKNAIKKEIEPGGYLAGQIKKKFTSRKEFVDAVSKLLDGFNKGVEKGKKKTYDGKNEIGQEYAKILQAVKAGKEPDVPETDFWLIPCRTYEQLHSVAQKYAGVLPIMSRDEIQSEYDINVPEKASHYETSKTPEQFLEYMKKQTNFFMDPSWCIVKNKNFFDRYKLETSENEKPRCYVFISKKYPNVRFCVTLKKEKGEELANIKDEKIKFTTNGITLDEVRDPWQIGGFKRIKVGLDMMRLAFGQQKIDQVIDDICFSPEAETKIVPFSKLKDGSNLFYGVESFPFINGSFDNLICGYAMFNCSDFEKVNCNFPVLEDGHYMFSECETISEFKGNLPKLINGESMFSACYRLKKFECENLPELENGEYMFTGCEHLEKFECNLPKLKRSERMFCNCRSLESFNGDLSSMEKTHYMFLKSGIKTFKSNLPVLNSAEEMFSECVELETFDAPLPKLEDGDEMFFRCRKLKTFNSKLPNLKYAKRMFDCCDLIKFEIDMPNLIVGPNMFYRNENLKRFNCKMPKLESGKGMFNLCENLTSFRSDLSSLKDGYDMFSGCKLDTESVKNIAETIARMPYTSTITIGIDKMDKEKEKYLKMIEEKGWKVEIA